MFYEPTAKYPDGHPTVGRYLGPATDVGGAMTHKVLKQNGEVVYRSTARAWTQEEEVNPVFIQKKKEFMESIYDNCGPAATVSDFPPDAITPDFEYYADEEQEDGFEGTPDEVLPPTPEFGDNLVGARVLMPRGEGTSHTTVKKRARDNYGNPIGKENQNPILDIR